MHAVTEAVPPLAASDLWLVSPLHGKLGEGGIGDREITERVVSLSKTAALSRLARNAARSRNEGSARYWLSRARHSRHGSHRPGISPSFLGRSPSVNRILSLLSASADATYTRRSSIHSETLPKGWRGFRRPESLGSGSPQRVDRYVDIRGPGVREGDGNGGKCSAG